MSTPAHAAVPTHPRERRRLILAIGLPIIGGMLSQNLLNLVDTAFVGRLADSDNALAAVGTGGIAAFLAVAFMMGLSAGVQAMVSRRLGEGRSAELAIPLNGALLAAVVIGVPLTAILWFAVPELYPLLNSDPAVQQYGIPYVQIRVLAMVGVGCNFAFRGFWNGTNRSALYMRSLVVMHLCNILLNWLLIFGNLGFPELGTDGAAIGTAISTYIGVAYYFGLARGRAREQGFLKALPKLNDFKTLIRVSLPSGTQTCLMALGYNMLYWIYGELGTLEVAASNVVINILLVAMLPAIGLGLASASLVGQALGRGDVEDARRWGWDVVKVAVVMLFFIGAPMWLATKEILGFFLQNPETIELAYTPLILIGAFAWLDGIGAVLMNSIIGAGDSRRALLLSVSMQWGLFLPGAYLVGVEWGTGLVGCWVANIVWRGLQALVFVAQWRSNAWTRVKV